jgi:tetratricopeptide (TPR) repeat protein
MQLRLFSSLLSLLKAAIENLVIDGRSPIDLQEVVQWNLTPKRVAELWITSADADKSNTWPHPFVRVYVLVALFRKFEDLRLYDYANLRFALGKFQALSGQPLNVIGTKCELGFRAAEALFLEGRREPGSALGYAMMEVANDLLNSGLTECNQKDNPKFSKRWYGIRGVCGLMLTAQREFSVVQEQYDLFKAAANDIQRAFELGNRGPSAATYLLDALWHLYTIDQSEATLVEIGAVIDSLDESEKNDRGVLFFVGRYYFARSFSLSDNRGFLISAMETLDRALSLPAVLSVDDAIVRLIRGQIYVRMGLSFPNEASTEYLETLNLGIEDLKFAFEYSPEKFAKQSSLPSVLQSRADLFAKTGRYAEAREDLKYATRDEFAAAHEELTSQALVKLLLVDLREASDKQDLAEMERLLAVVLDHGSSTGVGGLQVGGLQVGLTAKRVFGSKTDADNPALLIRAVDLLGSVDLSKSDAESQRLHFSVLAGLQFLLGNRWLPEALEDSVATYLQALSISSSHGDVELLSLYGNCCLSLAKNILANEHNNDRAIELLEEASDALATASEIAEAGDVLVSDAFKLVVTFSKAGEAQLRLCTLTGSAAYGLKAIHSFERAYELGNTAHELFGVLGDACYRVSRLLQDRDLLQQAVNYKRMAREAGSLSRENLSLSSRLALMQWEHSGDAKHLIEAITLAAQAHEASPTWPWPPFQLLEIADRAGDQFASHLQASASTNPTLALLAVAGGKDKDPLVRLACTLVLENEEFAKKNLGGRQPVYVMEDSHRLLSESYVFKHTNKKSATRDRQVITEFTVFLRQKGLRGFRLPEPIAIIPHDFDNVTYVMRRARGHHLGRAVIQAKREGSEPPIKEFEQALSFLATYHAWGLTILNPSPEQLNRFILNYIRDDLDLRLEIPVSTTNLAKQIDMCPRVLKKDAHPENWLVDDFGNICMIDFESSKTLPVLFEVVQLIDDYPLLEANRESFEYRARLSTKYMSELEALSGVTLGISSDSVGLLYAIFAVLRCGFGLQRSRRLAKAISSSSALRARAERHLHYEQLLSWLSTEHLEIGIQEFATAIFKSV